MRYIFFFSLLLIAHRLSAQEGTIKDIDGNEYDVKKIGSQFWMLENLKTTRYSDGTPIQEMEMRTPWTNTDPAKQGAWCYYNTNPDNNYNYGKLYNQYAVVSTHHLCPSGWHIPSGDEFILLADYLGGGIIGVRKLTDSKVWDIEFKDADNSSGFSALPGGTRLKDGSFWGKGIVVEFWQNENRWITTDQTYPEINAENLSLHDGCSVRCIADTK